MRGPVQHIPVGRIRPALVADEVADDLTPREREVVELAAGGISSRDIALRLGITIRTVDNMLGRVYTKLGIANRSALAAMMRPSLGD